MITALFTFRLLERAIDHDGDEPDGNPCKAVNFGLLLAGNVHLHRGASKRAENPATVNRFDAPESRQIIHKGENIMAMSTGERKDFDEKINSMRAAIFSLVDRVGALESELQELRNAATNEDAPRSLASVISEAADYQRFMQTH